MGLSMELMGIDESGDFGITSSVLKGKGGRDFFLGGRGFIPLGFSKVRSMY